MNDLFKKCQNNNMDYIIIQNMLQNESSNIIYCLIHLSTRDCWNKDNFPLERGYFFGLVLPLILWRDRIL